MLLMEIIDGYKQDIIDEKYDKVIIRFLEFDNEGEIIIEENGQVTVTGDIKSVDLNRNFSLIREKIQRTNKTLLIDDEIMEDKKNQKIMHVGLDDTVYNWTVLKVLSFASDGFMEDSVHVAIDKELLAVVKQGMLVELHENLELPNTVNEISIRIVNGSSYINIINKKDL